MGKSRGVDVRRARGGEDYTARIRGSYRKRLRGVPREDGRMVLGREGLAKKTPTWKSDGCANWRVRREDGDVLAIEPDGVYEHVFDGDDPWLDALIFAAEQLRKEMS